MSAVIRSLQADDYTRWLELWREYLVFYASTQDEALSRITFQRLLDAHEPMGAFVALRGDRVMGFAHFILHRSCWTAGDYCYLQDLFVDAEARGCGLGRQLIASLHDYAKGLGCSRLYWLTQESNQDARALYDKIAECTGFIHYRQMISL